MELELESSHESTPTSEVHLHGYLRTTARYPRAMMLPGYPRARMLLSLKMTFSIRWHSSSPNYVRDIRLFREFTPSLSDTMLHGDRVWEQAVEGMLVSAIAPSHYNPSAEDMGVFVRSICAYGDSALLHWFRSPTHRSFVLKTFIIFYDDPPPPVAAVDFDSTQGLDFFDFLYNYDLFEESRGAWLHHYCRYVDSFETRIHVGRENDFRVGTEAAAIRGLETSIYGGGDHVEQTGETTTSCIICLGEYEVGVEIVTMPCGHLFHDQCLREWLQRRHTCPFCRFPLR